MTKVDVSGGKETNPLWTAQVSSEAFKTALEQSLALAGYMGTGGPAMQVQANLVNLHQPLAGFDLSVTSQVRYTVTREGRPVFDETVSATGTASMGEAFMAVERLRIANEKSIRENIKAFLTRFRARTLNPSHAIDGIGESRARQSSKPPRTASAPDSRRPAGR